MTRSRWQKSVSVVVPDTKGLNGHMLLDVTHTHTLLHTDLHAENITRQRCQRLVLIALYKIQKYIYQFKNHVLHYIFGMEDSQG